MTNYTINRSQFSVNPVRAEMGGCEDGGGGARMGGGVRGWGGGGGMGVGGGRGGVYGMGMCNDTT